MIDELAQALAEAWNIAYGERHRELDDKPRAKLLDERGLHPWSEVWGRIFYIEAKCIEQVPAAGETITVAGEYGWEVGAGNPHELRKAARHQATEDWLVQGAHERDD